jgi:hypothetical protein
MLTGFGLQHISSLLIKHASSVLFVQITSDGHSGSGQTPGIAWEKFQKKGCPRMKIWHGKRFSGKIDGVEVDIGDFHNQWTLLLLQKNYGYDVTFLVLL